MALGVQALEGTQALERETGPASVGKQQGKGVPGSGPAGVALARRTSSSPAGMGVECLPQGALPPRTG